jgi:DNA polymerase theta
VGDAARGFQLELLMTKLRYVAQTEREARAAAAAARRSSASPGGGSQRGVRPLQLIGMSATLPNLDEVARWVLQAAGYCGQ